MISTTARLLRKAAALGLATAALLALSTAVDAGTAAAATINCKNMPGQLTIDPTTSYPNTRWYAYAFSNPVVTPTFDVSDTRIATNDLTTPITVTFTSQVAKTFTITASSTMSASLLKFLTVSVSSSITQSRTTTVGVSTTATVAPNSTVKGQYGVRAYDVAYDVTTYTMQDYQAGPGMVFQSCTETGPARQTTNAPTADEGWVVSPG
jgi:hypothetical protein